ncbi:MAG: sugar kinase [Burkholderiaceae bacterium]|nr:sugar kinase [Burkholderiaceae bacterium]
MHDKSFDIVAIGEAMVEFNQTGDLGGRTYLQGFGGDTSNAVIAASRQGARCAYFTRLGDDDFGRMLLDLWQREGVTTDTVAVDASAPTGIYFVCHDHSGHSFSYLRAGSAASRMQPADLPAALLRRTKILHVSGISQAISLSATEAIAHAIRLAGEVGALIAYDPNLRLKLWPLALAREVILATIPLCDHFLPSLDDVQLVSGLTAPEDIVAWCHRIGAKTVVLKLGRHGSLVSDGRRCVAVAAHPVDAVDATGAGDCFDGSYLAQVAKGADPVTAARWASAAAALATTGFGAVDPLPTSEQVHRLVERRSA